LAHSGVLKLAMTDTLQITASWNCGSRPNVTAGEDRTKRGRPSGRGTLFRRKADGPWLASWSDPTGRRKERSTRTADRRAAARILARRVA